MLKENARLFQRLNQLSDYFIIIISVFCAVITEQFYHGRVLQFIDINSFNLITVPFVIVVWAILINLQEKTAQYRRTGYFTLFKNTLLFSFISAAILISISFLMRDIHFHRSTLLFFSLYSFSFLLIKRWSIKFYLNNIRRKGFNTRNILIVGSNSKASELINQIRIHREYGYRIRGVIDPSGKAVNRLLNKYTIEGNYDQFEKIIAKRSIDEVFFTSSHDENIKLTEHIEFLASIGVNYHVLLDLAPFTNGMVSNLKTPYVHTLFNLPVVSYQSSHIPIWQSIIKHTIEMGICACIFIALLPIFILVAILIKITSKGPVFFRQERVGYHGRIFKVIKFRTMCEGADSKITELMDQNEQSGPVFKMTNDPRITPIGNLLRKYSIDELPQIFNVFSGDMGLVGPRPAIIDEVKEYKPEWRRRLSMKPGITGLWQVSGRNNIKDFDEWVKLDVEYIDNWSFWMDLKIILKTIPAILIGTGK